MVNPAAHRSPKYRQILASIREVGIIEPPVVSRSHGKYILLDGHMRVHAFEDRERGDRHYLVLQKLCRLGTNAVQQVASRNTYSKTYARMLLAATPKDQLVDPEKPKKIKGLDEDQMARMESEMESLQREYRLIEENYGKDVLNLTLTKGYLGSILGNAKVVRYLAQNHSDILTQFQKIADISSLAKEASA